MADQLHCGEAVYAWLRDKAKPVEPNPVLPSANALLGVPVILHRESEWSGRWEYRDGDEVLLSGRIGDEGEQVAYVAGQGFLAFRPDAIATYEVHD